jgi:hypothetical protein
MRGSKVSKPTQFLIPFAMQHIENTFDAQDGVVVTKPLDGIQHNFYLFSYPVDDFFNNHVSIRKGHALHFNLNKR